MNFNQYECGGGVAKPVNPFEEYVPRYNFNGSIAGQSKSQFYQSFQTWLQSQPTIHCSPEIKGIYPVGEFGEVVWQYEIENEPDFWFSSRDQSHFKGGFSEYTEYMLSIGCKATRLFLEHIGPKKQESDPFKAKPFLTKKQNGSKQEKRFIIPEQGMPAPLTTFEGKYGFPMSDINFENQMTFVWTLGDKSGMNEQEKRTLLEIIQMYLEGVESNNKQSK